MPPKSRATINSFSLLILCSLLVFVFFFSVSFFSFFLNIMYGPQAGFKFQNIYQGD